MKEVIQFIKKLENSIAAMQNQLDKMGQNVGIIQQDFDIFQRCFEAISMAHSNSTENVPKVCQKCAKNIGNSSMETVETLKLKRKDLEHSTPKSMEYAKSVPKPNFQGENRAIVYNTISTPKGGANISKKNTKIKDPSGSKKNIVSPIKKEVNFDLKEVRKTIPPKLEWIKMYCTQRNNGVDPRLFFDFYKSKGWLVGKVKMKDWQASVRTWERSHKKEEKIKPPIYDDGIKYIWDAKIQKYRHSVSGTIYIP